MPAWAAINRQRQSLRGESGTCNAAVAERPAVHDDVAMRGRGGVAPGRRWRRCDAAPIPIRAQSRVGAGDRLGQHLSRQRRQRGPVAHLQATQHSLCAGHLVGKVKASDFGRADGESRACRRSPDHVRLTYRPSSEDNKMAGATPHDILDIRSNSHVPESRAVAAAQHITIRFATCVSCAHAGRRAWYSAASTWCVHRVWRGHA